MVFYGETVITTQPTIWLIYLYPMNHQKHIKFVFVISSAKLNQLLQNLAAVIMNKFATKRYKHILLHLNNLCTVLQKIKCVFL